MDIKKRQLESEPLATHIVRGEWNSAVLPMVDSSLQPVGQQVIDITLAAYGEPGRSYHTAEHIADCFSKLNKYQGRDDYLQLFLGLLWHDVVYDTVTKQSSDASNEEKSADFAVYAMDELKLPGQNLVYELIRSTEKHNPQTEAEALFCDIDMMILAAPEKEYDRYVGAIRQEYSVYSDEQFRVGRLMALKSFGQPFHHPDFVHLNELAFMNIDREIEYLEKFS